ncbi:energy transducer TonB [Thermovibrio sp.]
MGAPVRFIVALLISALLEWAFIKSLPYLLSQPKREVSRVIKISLYKPQVKTETIKVERRKGNRKVNEEVKKVKKPPKPKVVSKAPVKKAPEKEVKETKKREKKRGGLKPLQGNLPAWYVDKVREAIQENIFYPLEALQEGIEGPVMVQFTLGRNGEVLECKPLFGPKILEEATCLAIKKSSFPPIPKEIKNDKLTFQLQLEYNLKKALPGG